METLAPQRGVDLPTQGGAKPTEDDPIDTSNTALTESGVKSSVLEKFLSLRGLTSPQGRVKNPPKLTAETLCKTYTKRRNGNKAASQRAALCEPEDIFSDSVDAYVPRKRKQELMNLHKEEREVNDVFLTETRALSYEREVLDKVVCDREENRELFEDRLWQLMVQECGLQPVEDGDEDALGQVQLEQNSEQDVGLAMEMAG